MATGNSIIVEKSSYHSFVIKLECYGTSVPRNLQSFKSRANSDSDDQIPSLSYSRPQYAVRHIWYVPRRFNQIISSVNDSNLASHELHDAFNALVSSSSQRGLIASIRSEELVPTNIIPSSSADFFDDLQALSPILKDDEAAFVILRRHADATDGYVAVTYVPDNAKVRQKMLFASTRLTLVRELGTERFRETLFATTKQELTAEGWQKHDRHGQQEAPLTEEEQTLQRVKEAEAEASHGTTSRNSHANHHLNIPLSDAALQALKELPTGSNNLVQLVRCTTVR